jgi:hypothetical protein
MEQITMAEVVYIPVNDAGEPYCWGEGDEYIISVFGDFWRAWRSPESKGKVIRALALEDLQELLHGPWGDITHVSYRPSADGYIKSRENVLQTVIEGVTN